MSKNLISEIEEKLPEFSKSQRYIAAFIKDDIVIMYGVRMLRSLMITGPFLGVLFTFTFSFQAMGRAIPSLILSAARQGLIFIPLLFITNSVWGLDGVIYAQPATEIISLIVAVIMFAVIIGKINKQAQSESEAAAKP